MNLQELGLTPYYARISISAQELYGLCVGHRDIAMTTAHVLPPQGPTYEELVAATLRHCPEAVIVPRDRVVKQWALDRMWKISREDFDKTWPNAHIDHWLAYKSEFVRRARASVLESIVYCLTKYPACVFYEHGRNVNGQPYKGCRYGVLHGQTFNAFEY